ncbi:MAG: RHS repeat-associated core domain-containing protein, partial [Defluviitaleaceae bacterium]|nr:RHS repeat-associated core domain-containing protein [Defluviitaleaceae bacterium]
YQYNGLGHRTGQTIGDMDLNPMKQIDDVLDLTASYHNLLQRSENGRSTSFTYEFGILGSTSNGVDESYLLDELGSPVRFGDEAYLFDEFGNGLHETSNQPFGFTGYRWEESSSSYFAQQRQYNPETGRFISQDLVKGFKEAPYTLNQYTYCWNDPLNLVDLDGLMPSSYDAARMADYIYDRNGTMTAEEEYRSVVNGWELTYIHRNTNNWFTRNLSVRGLVMGVFRYTHDDGMIEYALVNQGTNTWYNWIDNVRQGIGGQSLDTRDSVRFARQFVEARPGIEVTMIGHSKGGAEARANAWATGMNAILFNPADSHQRGLRQYGISADDIANYGGTMITYIIEGEILNFLQGWYADNPGWLRRLRSPSPEMGRGERHGMAAMIVALYLKYSIERETWIDLDYIRERFGLSGLDHLEFDNACP